MWPENQFEYTAPDGISYDSPKQYIWIEVFGYCGCHDDYLFDLTFQILENLYQAKLKNTAWFYEYQNVSKEYCALQELILHSFDAKEITEHGSSVRGSWLTDKGIELAELARLEYVKKDTV